MIQMDFFSMIFLMDPTIGLVNHRANLGPKIYLLKVSLVINIIKENIDSYIKLIKL